MAPSRLPKIMGNSKLIYLPKVNNFLHWENFLIEKGFEI
jgi:hypothetical protein